VAASWTFSLREGSSVAEGEAGEVVIAGPSSRVLLRGLGPATLAALHNLTFPGMPEAKLAESVHTGDGAEALARWYYALQHLARRGQLLVSAHAGKDRLATLVPMTPAFTFTGGTIVPERPCILSRFAYLRRGDGEMVLESPRSFARVLLHDDRASALVHALTQPTSAGELGGRVLGLPGAAAGQLLGLLAAAGVVREVDDDDTTDEDTDPALRSWEFHDLLFHARSREGRHEYPVGGTYRLAGTLDPPAAVKPVAAGEMIELYRPDLEQLARDDPPFAQVQEQRCSIRDYADEPITDRQLGELLYRVARVKELREWEVPTTAGTVRMETAARPYPAGGALYELEFYAVVSACRGLEPGLYHYDALGHRLGRLTGPSADTAALLANAGRAAGIEPERVQVLLVLSARFPRLAWKYESLAYALTLKHVGVVYQTLYLAATAMDLAPCALGVGDSDCFARAAGLDYYGETSVGEFLLGSRR
jgi:SagB-type dehydrogenase family enzyme